MPRVKDRATARGTARKNRHGHERQAWTRKTKDGAKPHGQKKGRAGVYPNLIGGTVNRLSFQREMTQSRGVSCDHTIGDKFPSPCECVCV